MGNMETYFTIHGCAVLYVTVLTPNPEFMLYTVYYERPDKYCALNVCKHEQIRRRKQVTTRGRQI